MTVYNTRDMTTVSRVEWTVLSSYWLTCTYTISHSGSQQANCIWRWVLSLQPPSPRLLLLLLYAAVVVANGNHDDDDDDDGLTLCTLQRTEGQNPLHRFPRSKSVRNKLARAKVRCVCCVVSFPKFHCNDLLPTSWRQVGNVPSTGKLRENVCNGFWALRRLGRRTICKTGMSQSSEIEGGGLDGGSISGSCKHWPVCMWMIIVWLSHGDILRHVANGSLKFVVASPTHPHS